MNKILLLLLTMIFTGCQVAYVRPPSGDMAGNFTVNQGFSRSVLGEGNELNADVTKTAAILTAEVNPELSSEINPALASEINPELDTNINAEISDIYKNEAAPEEKSEPAEEEGVETIDETEE